MIKDYNKTNKVTSEKPLNSMSAPLFEGEKFFLLFFLFSCFTKVPAAAASATGESSAAPLVAAPAAASDE